MRHKWFTRNRSKKPPARGKTRFVNAIFGVCLSILLQACVNPENGSVAIPDDQLSTIELSFAPVGTAYRLFISEGKTGEIISAEISLTLTITEGRLEDIETTVALPIHQSRGLLLTGKDSRWVQTGDNHWTLSSCHKIT